ncbi:MAG: tRNA pseudouridine(55) synthase TruB [Rubrivivax sp.]
MIDKPLGWTSNDALQKARGLLRALKAGHTGTLDPLATGLLPLCFGAATKFAQASLDADKRYRATLRLGQRSSTLDGEGEITPGAAPAFDRAVLDAACAALTGPIAQRPPMHSALKKDGRPLYDYARAGIEVERAPRQVVVHRIEIVEWVGAHLVLDIACSKGTYVRTLASDLGDALGCGAWLQALRRTASGRLDVADAISIDALSALPEHERAGLLRPSDLLLADWPAVCLPDDEAGRFLTGLRRRVTLADAPAVRVYASTPAPSHPDGAPDPRAFLGSAHIAGGELIADRLLSPLEVQAQT